MSFPKTVLFFREDTPPDGGGGGADAPPASKGFYPEAIIDVYAPAADDVPPVVPTPPADTPPATPPVEPPTVPPVTPPVIPAPATPPSPLPVDWKEAIKDADWKEVMKAKGFDDFAIKLMDYGKTTGNYTPFLEATTVDYTKLSNEQLIRLQAQQAEENKGMSEKAFNFKFNKDFKDKYFLDREVHAEDSEEAEFGQELLRLDGERLKAQFIEKQQNFKAPEVKPDADAAQREAQQQQLRTQINNQVANDPATVALKTQNTISFGEGEDSFNYPVTDIESVIANTQALIANSGQTQVSSAELKKIYSSMIVGRDLENFIDLYGKHINTIALRKFQAEIGNITPVNDGTVVIPPPVADKGFYPNRG